MVEVVGEEIKTWIRIFLAMEVGVGMEDVRLDAMIDGAKKGVQGWIMMMRDRMGMGGGGRGAGVRSVRGRGIGRGRGGTGIEMCIDAELLHCTPHHYPHSRKRA